MDALTTTREDLADIRRAEFLLGRSAERARIRQLALCQADDMDVTSPLSTCCAEAFRDFAALLEER